MVEPENRNSSKSVSPGGQGPRLPCMTSPLLPAQDLAQKTFLKTNATSDSVNMKGKPAVGGGGGLVAKSCPTVFDPTDHSLPGSSVHGISQARNTGVGCHVFLQIFPIQGMNWCLLHFLHCR